MTATDWAGRPVCQVRGCEEPARPWGYVLDWEELELEVMVCPRHERELIAWPPPNPREAGQPA